MAFRGMGGSQMECKTLPGTPKYINGVSYWIPYTDQIEPLLEELSQVNSSES